MNKLNKSLYETIDHTDCILLNSLRQMIFDNINLELNDYSQETIHDEIDNSLYNDLRPLLCNELYE